MRTNKTVINLLVVGILSICGTEVEAQRISLEALTKSPSASSEQLKTAPQITNKSDAEVGSFQIENFAATDKKIMVGSWLETVTFSGGPMPPIKSLVTFTEDGSVVVADQGAVGTGVAFSAGHGSWAHSSGRTFDWTTVELLYSTTDGTLIGFLKVRGKYTVNETGNAYTGQFLATISAPDGTVLFTVDGTNAGTRIPVEPLP